MSPKPKHSFDKVSPPGRWRYLFIFLIIAIGGSAFFISGVSAAAYNGTCGDDLTWTLNTDSGVLKISGTGDMYDYFYHSSSELPDWYEYRDSIKTISLDPRMTSIGDCAFYQCTAIQNVAIPNSVTSIGHYAFYRCIALTHVTIGYSVTTIGIGAFEDCTSLASIIIPDSVTNIRTKAFKNCNALASVTFGNRIISIDDSAFISCYNLETVDLSTAADLAVVGANAFGYDTATSLKYGSSIYVPDSDAAALFNETNYYSPYTSLKYVITYNANDDRDDVVRDTVKESVGTFIIAANTFTRTGYTFAGWNSKADGSGKSYAPNDPYSTTRSVTFYAEWVLTPTDDGYGSVTSNVSITTTPEGVTGTFRFSDSPVNVITIDGVIHETASITITEGLPFGVSAPFGQVADTFDITPYSVASMNTSTIFFSIPVSKISDAGFDTRDVTLMHYEEETWVRIPTTLTEVENGNANYTAIINSYSAFAITFSRGATDIVVEPTPVITPDTPAETPTTAVPTDTPTPTTASTASPVPLFGILAGLGIAAYVRYGRR